MCLNTNWKIKNKFSIFVIGDKITLIVILVLLPLDSPNLESMPYPLGMKSETSKKKMTSGIYRYRKPTHTEYYIKSNGYNPKSHQHAVFNSRWNK